MPLTANQIKLKQRLQDKRLNLVTNSWIQNGDALSQKRQKVISQEKIESMVSRIKEKAYSQAKRKMLRRGHGFKEGGNAIVFFNKKKGHVVKVFPKGTIGDQFSPTTRTFQKTLSYCIAQINGQTFSQIEKEIKRIQAQVERMKSKKINPALYDPNPTKVIEDLRRRLEKEVATQQESLKSEYPQISGKESKIIPFVYSIRLPKIFSEKRLASGEYAVSMEYIRGPTLSELLEGMEKNPETTEGIQASNFIKKNNLDSKTLRTKITLINRALVEASTRHLQNSQTPFIPRMDSFIVEGIDRHGNLKLVLVDNA